jgi:hypothetical protein
MYETYVLEQPTRRLMRMEKEMKRMFVYLFPFQLNVIVVEVVVGAEQLQFEEY